MVEEPESPSWGNVFASWHRDASLYREIYARTVSALAAALVVFVIAAFAGLVTLDAVRAVAWSVTYLAGGLYLAAMVTGPIMRKGKSGNRLIREPTRRGRAYKRLVYWSLVVGVVMLLSVAVLHSTGTGPLPLDGR